MGAHLQQLCVGVKALWLAGLICGLPPAFLPTSTLPPPHPPSLCPPAFLPTSLGTKNGVGNTGKGNGDNNGNDNEGDLNGGCWGVSFVGLAGGGSVQAFAVRSGGFTGQGHPGWLRS